MSVEITESTGQKITINLWFDSDAEEAATYYVSTFQNASLGNIQRYGAAATEVSGQPEGSAMTVSFELEGQQFLALNGGPHFKFNPSISFHIKCATKSEVDEFWGKLSEGGEILMPLGEYPFSARYGWCMDKYGVSWQVIFAGDSEMQQKITPVLMFVGDVFGKAEEAVNFYSSVFEMAKVDFLTRYGKDEGPNIEGTVRYAAFSIYGQEFGAMDSALEHNFAFNEAISFIVDCKDQDEVDYFWDRFTTNGGEESMCAWLKDKYGVSWQIVPRQLIALLEDEDPEKSGRVMQAMLQMKKIDVNKLEQAYKGG